MQLERITWKILADAGNPCKLCRKNEAAWFATIKINESGSITLPLCVFCVDVPETEIIDRVLGGRRHLREWSTKGES